MDNRLQEVQEHLNRCQQLILLATEKQWSTEDFLDALRTVAGYAEFEIKHPRLEKAVG